MSRGGEADDKYNLLVVGGSAVGKSALAARFLTTRYCEDNHSLPDDLYFKRCYIDDRNAQLNSE